MPENTPKHRSEITEADRTDPEWGYRPDCGHWYFMKADGGGQHRSVSK